MVDGNVWLHAGKDKNITFKTTGNGRIYVDETDVSKLPDIVGRLLKLSKKKMNELLQNIYF